MGPHILIWRPSNPQLRGAVAVSRVHNMDVIAMAMKLDAAKIRRCLEEFGRVDTDDYTLIPEDPNDHV